MIVFDFLNSSIFDVSDEDSIHKSLEVLNEDEVGNLEAHEKFDQTGMYGIDRNVNNLNQDFMPNCPQPNVTYNGSLLSSGKVKLSSLR